MTGHLRYYHLDTLRAGLMLLGVVIHAAFVFTTERNWLIASLETHRFFDYLIFIIHTFRMPAFFLLSGFLYALVLARSSGITFFLSRTCRIGIPLLAGGIIFNFPQLWLFQAFGPEWNGALIAKTSCSTYRDFYNGCWVIHLWFLVALAYFFIIGTIVHWVLSELSCIINWSIKKIPGPENTKWPLTVIIFSIFGYIVQSMHWRGGSYLLEWLPLIRPLTFFQYLPFFLAGFIFQRSKSQLETWSKITPYFVILLATSWTIHFFMYLTSELKLFEYLFSSRNVLFIYYAVSFQTIAALIILSKKIPFLKSTSSQYLSDISYTIYITHHILIFIFSLLINNINTSLFIKFTLIILLTLIISGIFHHFIIYRYKIMRILINGRI